MEAELKDLSAPATVAGMAAAVSFLSRKLTGYSLGVDTHNLAGVTKAFLLITASGGAAIWYNKKYGEKIYRSLENFFID